MERGAASLRATMSVLAVALLLAWPALVNGYPILFSDTHAFLVQAGQPRMVWDKPWAYGPFLLALHGDTTLWLPLAGQVLILSHLLWLLAARRGVASPGRHLLLGVLLAVGSAVPWVASLLMPDMFAPVVVIGLSLLARPGGLGRWRRGWLTGLTAAAIAFHLAHLVIAAACLPLAGRGWRRAALPLGLALGWLAATNVVGFHRLAISPFGAVMALARLTADGAVAPVLARACPAAGWRLCDWRDRLPEDSDAFLWAGDGPVWSDPGGAMGFAPEAAAIVTATLLQEPGRVLRAAAANTVRQLGRIALGDTLGPDWLAQSVAGSLAAWFPPEEGARFRAGRQMAGTLRPIGAALTPWHAALLALGTLATAACLFGRERWLAAMVLAGLAANAFATGALSGPHDRYQARIAWLVLLPPLLAAGRPRILTDG